eukprot:4944836-Pyramimonas_sp.AAC.1
MNPCSGNVVRPLIMRPVHAVYIFSDERGVVQVHPMCSAVTHKVDHTYTQLRRDDLRFVPPAGLTAGSKVIFKATVVREYTTWFAFEQAYVVGQETEQVEPGKAGVGRARRCYPSSIASCACACVGMFRVRLSETVRTHHIVADQDKPQSWCKFGTPYTLLVIENLLATGRRWHID